jgi:hypothetical protein
VSSRATGCSTADSMEFSGRVVFKPFAEGTKSERVGIYLVTDQGEYLLRRKGGNPFHDPVLEGLAGSRIRCQGTLHGYTLILTSYEVLT